MKFAIYGYLLLVFMSATSAAEDSLNGNFADSVQPLLTKYCLRCHGPEEQNGQLRYDHLSDYNEADQHLWTMVHQAVKNGEMPPEGEPQPTATEKQKLLTWIAAQAAARHRETANSQRRLNRRELSASLQDLTGLPINFAAALPEDGTIDGFDTGAAGLQDAADSVSQFLEVSQRAVDSIRFLEPEGDSKIQVDFREQEFAEFRKFVDQRWKSNGIFTKSSRLRCQKGEGVFLPTQWAGDRGSSFLAFPAPADKRGTLKMTLQVAAKRPLPGLPTPTLWVSIGGEYIDYRAISETSQTLTYAVRMEDAVIENGDIKVMLRCFVEMPYAVDGFENDDRSKPEDNIPGGIGIYRPKFDRKLLRTPEEQPVPSIVIESIEVDYDHRAAWPPANWHADLGVLEDDDECAKRLLTLWMERAWRRPVGDDDRQKFLSLYQQLRKQEFSFDDALRATFQAVLLGGPFRYLASPTDANPLIAQHAIASRLSFMLVGSPPDEPLRNLAAAGKLRDPNVLNDQVDRLLADPRSEKFFRPFVMQWLQLNQPITLTMSHLKKQDFRFGRHLKASMQEETIAYIAQLFADNRPAKELISSDWTMMNDILAIHYKHEPLDGAAMRKTRVKTSADGPRGGGVLGHAGIQSMLCWMGDNWVIYRGAWTLKHILDDPPPPPPLEVPELLASDQENRGKSFRELLVQHQADAKCAVCHRKMDPLGFAFQNFDLSGRWRNDEYERYLRNELDGKIEWRGQGKTRPVDAVGHLPRGEEFSSFAECKKLIVEHYMDDIVRGILKKLTLFGTGRKPSVVDMAAIEEIMQQHKKKNYPMRDLLKSFIRSDIFLGNVTMAQ